MPQGPVDLCISKNWNSKCCLMDNAFYKKRKRWEEFKKQHIREVAMFWKFAPPPPPQKKNGYVEILTLKDDGISGVGGEGETFGRCLGHEDGTCTNRMGALMKEAPESSLVPFTLWGHSTKLSAMNQEEGLHSTRLAPGRQASRAVRSKCLLYILVCDILLQQPK